MRISPIHRFVFVSTPKVCTHSIYQILDKHYSDGLVDLGFLHRNRVPHPFQELMRWTVVRNPYSRAVSIWWSTCRLAHLDQYKFRQKSGAEEDFVRFAVWLAQTSPSARRLQPLIRNQTDWLKPVEPITAIHLENLEQELAKLSFWKKGIEVPQLNTTAQKISVQERKEGRPIPFLPWPVLCQDKEAQEAILAWAAADFERFGYSKEIPL